MALEGFVSMVAEWVFFLHQEGINWNHLALYLTELYYIYTLYYTELLIWAWRRGGELKKGKMSVGKGLERVSSFC